MPITAAEVTAQIMDARAKRAIYQQLINIVRVSYMPVEGAGAEVQVAREDGGACTEEHFLGVLEEMEQRVVELAQELERWEGLTFEPIAEVRDMVEAASKRRGGGGKLDGRRIRQAAAKR